MAQGSGLPFPKPRDELAQAPSINADAVSSAAAWTKIAHAGERVSQAASTFGAASNTLLDRAAYLQEAGAIAKFENEWRAKNIEARDQFAKDPDGFKNWADATIGGAVGSAPPWIARHAENYLKRSFDGTYATLLAEKRSNDDRLAGQALTARQKAADQDVMALASAGKVGTAEFNAAMAIHSSVLDTAVQTRVMAPEMADFLRDDLSGRAQAEIAARSGVQVFRETGGDERAAVEHLRKEILENDQLTLSPAGRRRAFNAGRAAINEEKIGAQKARVGVIERGREVLKALESNQPVDPLELQEIKDEALRVGAGTLHRQLTVQSEVRQQTAHLGLSDKAALVRSRRPDVAAAIDEAAAATGVPASYLNRVAGRESTFNPNAQSTTSSAGGLFQFIDSTWRNTLAKYGAKYGLSPDTPKTDARANALMGAEFTKENANALMAAGIPVNDNNLYVAHFAGAGGAVKLLTADPSASAAGLLPDAAAANKTIFYNKDGSPRTVGQVIGRLSLGDAPEYTREITKGIQDSLIKDARKAWPTMQQQIKGGTLPSREDVNAIVDAAALSGDKIWYDQVVDVALAARIREGTQDQPQLDRQIVIDRARAQLSADTHKALEASFDRDNKLLRKDQLTYAMERKAATPGPLNLNDSNALRLELNNRSLAVQGVARDQGISPGSVFREPELDVVKATLEAASPDTKLRIFSDMASSLSEPVYRATMEALGNDTLTQFVGTVARDRPALAREILRGADLMGLDKTGDKQSLVRPAFQAVLGGALYPSAADQNNVTQAAMALYTARRGNTLYDTTDTAGIEKAIEDVTGKITKQGGVKVAAPPGMTAGQFHSTMSRLTTEQLGAFGGAFDRTGRAFDPKFLGDKAVLKQMGPGDSNYLVGLPDATARDGFAPVITAEGTPLVIDMKALAATAPPAPLTRYQSGVTGFRAGQAERIQDARQQSLEAP